VLYLIIDWRGLDFPYRRLYQSLGYLAENGDRLMLVSVSDEEIARDYDEVNAQKVVRTIRKFKREKRGGSRFTCRSSDDLNEAMIKLGESGAMLEKRDVEEARHLVTM
jgi:hypothetical protein